MTQLWTTLQKKENKLKLIWVAVSQIAEIHEGKGANAECICFFLKWEQSQESLTGALSLDTIYETTNINFQIQILPSKVNTRLQLKIFVSNKLRFWTSALSFSYNLHT